MAIHHPENPFSSEGVWREQAAVQPYSEGSVARIFPDSIDGTKNSLPEYQTTLENIRDLSFEYNPIPGIAKVVTSLAYMSDGSRNVVRRIVPVERKFEPHVAFTTPLATRVNGFNTYVGFELAKQGMAVDIVGAPQNMQDEDHLSHEAHNFSQIMTATNDEHAGSRSIIVGGMSRGAMEAPAITTYLKRSGHKTPLVIVQDPCLAKGLGIVETGKDMTPSYLLAEIVEGGKGLVERRDDESLANVGKHIVHLVGTLGISRKYVQTHTRITRELWKGQAGELLFGLSPETIMIMHFFKGSPFNHYRTYSHLTEHLPYARTILQDGLHLTMMRRSVTNRYVEQFVKGQEMLANGASQQEIADALNYPIVKPRLALAK